LSTVAIYTKKALLSQLSLWIGALALCGAMLYYWHNYGSEKRNSDNQEIEAENISVDQLLLTSGDLELGNTVNLININLNKNNNPISNSSSPIQTKPQRSQKYSRILEYKIKKIAPKEANGFTIKPIPQP